MTGAGALLVFLGSQQAAMASITADAGGPYTVDAEERVNLDASNTSWHTSCSDQEYRWDTDGDGGYDTSYDPSSEATFSAVGLDGPDTVTITVQAAGDCRGSATTDTDTATVTVDNVAPVVSGISGDTTVDEGEELSLELSYSDVESADTHSVEWDFDDGDTDTGDTVSHAWGDQGSFTVTATVTDDDGGSDSETHSVTVANVAPTVDGVSGDASGVEGDTLSFSVSYSDPGEDDTHTATWDFGDGDSDTGDSVSHTFATEGTLTVAVEVCDDDGDCGTGSTTVTIANAPPDSVSVSGDETGEEGEALSFTCEGSDPGGDPMTYTWDFGGDTDSGDSVSYAWSEDGSHTVTCTATDDAGESLDGTLEVVLANVAPEVDGTPADTTVEGEDYVFVPSVSDPGTEDTHTWSGTVPDGASVDAATGEISWTPGWRDAGLHALELVVTDDDGDSGSLSWSMEVTIVDGDGDGMSDLYEEEYGLDPDDASDASDDGDGDGWTNLQEYEAGTDPGSYDGPTAPLVHSPEDGGEVSALPLVLSVVNSESSRDAVLSYTFEVYEDETMSTLLDDVEGVAEGDGTTSWISSLTLTENSWYHWRARATDPEAEGDWGDPWSFFFNELDEAPSTPGLRLPFDGATVAQLAPDFQLDESTDPDEDPLTYGIAVESTGGAPIMEGDGIEALGGIVEWTATEDLLDGTQYCWTAWARDDDGLESDQADLACFEVDLTNAPPGAPTILEPVDDAAFNLTEVTVVVENGIDPEGRGTVHIFELDSSSSFTSDDLRTHWVDSGEDTTELTVSGLLDNTRYHLRVLTSDGSATSEWDQISFFINTSNHAPSVPTLHNPVDGGVLEPNGNLEVINSEDADGDLITYDFDVLDLDGEVVVSGTNVAENPAGTSAWRPGELEDGTYLWRARAVDQWGLASEWASKRRVVVGGGQGDDEVDGIDPDLKVAVTWCGYAGGGPGGALWGALLGLGLVIRRRR